MELHRHHAILFTGRGEKGAARVREHICNTTGMQIEGNPDFMVIERERFTIADARELKVRSNQMPLGNAQIFFIITETILREAQNALLKLLEEPAAQTYFYIMIPTERHLLPTIRSRMLFGGRIDEEDETARNMAQLFLSATAAERIAMLEPIIKRKNRREASSLLNAIESLLHADGASVHTCALHEVSRAQRYLKDRSSSVKLLLEHIAVTL